MTKSIALIAITLASVWLDPRPQADATMTSLMVSWIAKAACVAGFIVGFIDEHFDSLSQFISVLCAVAITVVDIRIKLSKHRREKNRAD